MSSNIKKKTKKTKQTDCMTAGSTEPPSSAWLPWLSSGSWRIGGIINSNMLGGCGCEHCLWARTSWLVFILLPPPGMQLLLQRNSWNHGASANPPPQKKQTGWKTLCVEALPLASTLCCSVIPLLINLRLSRWSYDAGDGSAVLILSLQELWRCSTAVAIGATRAQKTPVGMRWEDERSPHGRAFEDWVHYLPFCQNCTVQHCQTLQMRFSTC